MKDESSTILLLVVIAAVIFIGYNFIGKIKAAPITLVPQGTQAATNPTSQAAVNAQAVAVANASAVTANNALQQQQAAQNASALGALGTGLGSFISSLTSSGDNDDSDAYN